MSSTQEGSCTNIDRGHKGVRGEKASRRIWSLKEEAVLVVSLKDLVANGWKSDNGFRAGYLTRLEDAIAKEFPGTDLKAYPHINSKIQSWKKNYYSLNLMLSRSGVGWNSNGSYTIDCTDEQWDQIKKCDSNAKPMRLKSWQIFEDWQVIFGNDRAIGDHAEDMIDAVNNLIQEEERVSGNGKQLDDDEMFMDDVSVNDVGEQTSSQRDVEQDVKGKKKEKEKKRNKSGDDLHGVVEIFGEIYRGTSARLEMVANRIGHDFDVDQAKRDAYAALENIPDLDLEDRFKMCDVFTDQRNRLLTFQGLPDPVKAQYVQRLLKMLK